MIKKKNTKPPPVSEGNSFSIKSTYENPTVGITHSVEKLTSLL
jgi:hypothetical protein